MFHFTIFGGSEVTLSGTCKIIVTIFGGTDIRKPTLAKRLMQEKLSYQAEAETAPKPATIGDLLMGLSRPRRRGHFILTMFGAAEIKPPSLAEEFIDMRELIASGLVGESTWDQLVGRLYQMGDMDGISSCTLFGAMGEEPLADEEEIKRIQSARELGLITSDEERALRSVVGRDPQQVRMLLRQTAFAQRP